MKKIPPDHGNFTGAVLSLLQGVIAGFAISLALVVIFYVLVLQ